MVREDVVAEAVEVAAVISVAAEIAGIVAAVTVAVAAIEAAEARNVAAASNNVVAIVSRILAVDQVDHQQDAVQTLLAATPLPAVVAVAVENAVVEAEAVEVAILVEEKSDDNFHFGQVALPEFRQSNFGRRLNTALSLKRVCCTKIRRI